MDAELDVLSTLSNETRYTLVRVLVAAREELCVCELHAVVDVTVLEGSVDGAESFQDEEGSPADE